MIKKRKKINLIIGIIFGLVSNVLLFYTNILLTHNLSPENYGDYSVAISLAGLLYLIALIGLATLAPRELIFYRRQKKMSFYYGFLYKSLRIIFLSSILIVILILLISGIYLFLGGEYHELITVNSFLPIMCFLVFFNFYLISKNRVLLNLFFQIILIPLIFLILVLISIKLHFFNDITVPIIFGLAWTIVFLILVYLLKDTLIKSFKIKKKFETKKWLKMGSSILINNLFNISALPVSLLLLEALYPSEDDVGLYAVLISLLVPTTFGFMIISSYFIPHFVHLMYNIKRKKIYTLIFEQSLYLFIISLAIFIISLFFAKPILKIFGPYYVTGDKKLQLFLFLYMFITPLQIFPILNIYLKKLKYVFFSSLGFTILNIILGSFLISSYGILGCIITVTLVLFLFNIYNAIIFHKISLKSPK